MRGPIIGFWVRLHISLVKHDLNFLESDGDVAHRHERRVASAMMFCFRHSDVPGFCWFLLAANANSVRATATWRGTCKDIVVFFLTSPSLLAGFAAREFQGSRLIRSFTVSSLDGSNGLMTGNRLNLPYLCLSTFCVNCRVKFSGKFLMLSDGPDCVFPHTLTCVRTLRHVCSRILVSDSARYAARRNSELLMVRHLSQ